MHEKTGSRRPSNSTLHVAYYMQYFVSNNFDGIHHV